MGNIGPWEIALIVLAILLIFGPKQLPKVGRSLGLGMREFKDTVTEPAREIKEAVDTPKELLTFNPKKDIEDALNPFKEPDEPEAEVLEGEIVETVAPVAVEPDPVAETPAVAVASADAEPVAVAVEEPVVETSEPDPAAADKA
jgi:sec-independent protein translocase protein TatA